MYMTSLYFSDIFDKVVDEKNYFDLKEEIAKGFIKRFEESTGCLKNLLDAKFQMQLKR